MVYLKYTSKYVRFMLHVCDNLADFHTSSFLFKSFSSFPYLSRRAEISARAEISPCNQPLKEPKIGQQTEIDSQGISAMRTIVDTDITYKASKL